MSNYPSGLMSFWTREEWSQLKNKRTDHYAKLRNNMAGLEDQRRPVPMVRCRTAPNMLRSKTEYTESFKRPGTRASANSASQVRARAGFKYWYDEPLGMGTKQVPHWQKQPMGTSKTFFGLKTTPKTFLW